MSEAIQEVFKNIFGNNSILATIFISMLPIIELRGGIPFGMSKTIWGKHALSSWSSFGWSFLGSCLVIPILAWLFVPVINWLKKTKLFKKFALKIEKLIQGKTEQIRSKTNTKDIIINDKNAINGANSIDNNGVITIKPSITETSNNDEDYESMTRSKKIYNKQFFIKLFSVMLFVAIPLPLTGVWTGTAIAVLLGINPWWSCVTVIVGNFIAGIIMVTICAIFPNFTTIILLIFLGLTILFILFSVVKNKIKNTKANKN